MMVLLVLKSTDKITNAKGENRLNPKLIQMLLSSIGSTVNRHYLYN